MAILEGVVAFSHLNETEKYQGQDTGKYCLTLVLEDKDAKDLEKQGVRLKTYEADDGTTYVQRKFSTKYVVPVLDNDDQPTDAHLPRGSKVRIIWTEGDVHPNWGLGTYLNRVRVLERAEDTSVEEGF